MCTMYLHLCHFPGGEKCCFSNNNISLLKLPFSVCSSWPSSIWHLPLAHVDASLLQPSLYEHSIIVLVYKGKTNMHKCKQCGHQVVWEGVAEVTLLLVLWAQNICTAINHGRWKNHLSLDILFHHYMPFMNRELWGCHPSFILIVNHLLENPSSSFAFFHLEWFLSQQESSWIEMKRESGIAWRIG